MSRKAKIIVFSLILIISFIIKNDNTENNSDKQKSYDNNAKSNEKVIQYFPAPENGFSPYDYYFGKGVYNNSTQNSFKIKNDNSTDAVVLLVNAYSNKKIRNEYIRKGETFTMTGVPNGTYYLRWISGNFWHPDIKIGNLTGGFQKDLSFSETLSEKDWMTSDGLAQWTVTLYTVAGGTVGVDNLDANEFTK